MRHDQHFRNMFITAAEQQLAFLISHPEYTSEKQGGYLVVRSLATSTNLLVVPIGNIGYKAGKYAKFAQEKVARLDAHQKDGHSSSWQSRNPDADEWGGAVQILGTDYLISFSGLPELADEALVLATICSLDLMPQREAVSIANFSANHFFTKCFPHFTLEP